MNHNDHDSCTYVCIYLVFRRCCGCSCTQLQTHFRSLRSAADTDATTAADTDAAAFAAGTAATTATTYACCTRIFTHLNA